jgi:Fic family protein
MSYREVTCRWPSNATALGGRRVRRAFSYTAYVPDPIGDLDPPLPASLLALIDDAEAACAALDEEMPPSLNVETIARQLLRAESVASSRIEGLVVSHRRLARADFAGATDVTAQFVLQNIRGLERGLALAEEAERLSAETIRDVHREMFVGTRDEHLAGVVRTAQNWIGGEATSPANAEFVPPPPEEVPALLDDLGQFLNRDDLPPAIQAAIAHVQFETIHPFADGNGRVGRALIHVVLRRRGLIERFLPPVSLALAADPAAYVRGLTSFRYDNPDDWYEHFSQTLLTAARASREFARRVAALQSSWYEQAGRPRRGSATARLIAALPAHPVVNLRTGMAITGASDEAVLRALRRLERAGVIKQTTVGRRNRAFESLGLFALMDDLERSIAPAERTPAQPRT